MDFKTSEYREYSRNVANTRNKKFKDAGYIKISQFIHRDDVEKVKDLITKLNSKRPKV